MDNLTLDKHEIINSKGLAIAEADTIILARRKRDNADNRHGAYVHRIRRTVTKNVGTPFEQTITGFVV